MALNGAKIGVCVYACTQKIITKGEYMNLLGNDPSLFVMKEATVVEILIIPSFHRKWSWSSALWLKHSLDNYLSNYLLYPVPFYFRLMEFNKKHSRKSFKKYGQQLEGKQDFPNIVTKLEYLNARLEDINFSQNKALILHWKNIILMRYCFLPICSL